MKHKEATNLSALSYLALAPVLLLARSTEAGLLAKHLCTFYFDESCQRALQKDCSNFHPHHQSTKCATLKGMFLMIHKPRSACRGPGKAHIPPASTWMPSTLKVACTELPPHLRKQQPEEGLVPKPSENRLVSPPSQTSTCLIFRAAGLRGWMYLDFRSQSLNLQSSCLACISYILGLAIFNCMDSNINTSIHYHYNLLIFLHVVWWKIFTGNYLPSKVFQKINWKHRKLENTDLEMYKSKNKF